MNFPDAPVALDTYVVRPEFGYLFTGEKWKRGAGSNIVVPPVVPQLIQLIPEYAILGSQGVLVRAIGTGFTDATVVVWEGADQPTTFISAGELQVTMNSPPGEAQHIVTARTDTMGSNALPFGWYITSGNPPQIIDYTPKSAPPGPATRFTFDGFDFSPATSWTINGNPIPDINVEYDGSYRSIVTVDTTPYGGQTVTLQPTNPPDLVGNSVTCAIT